MTDQELRQKKEQLGISDYKLCYKTGVHYGVIESFFSGKSADLTPKDRTKLEAVIAKAAKR